MTDVERLHAIADFLTAHARDEGGFSDETREEVSGDGDFLRHIAASLTSCCEICGAEDCPQATITFDDLVEFGRQNGANIVNGMPWSFNYRGLPVTHENDDCYLITTPSGTLRIERGEVLHVSGDSIFVEAL